jgi:hypothetical protein
MAAGIEHYQARMIMKKSLLGLCIWLLFCGIAPGQVELPEGTLIRVRLEQDLSSATAQIGQQVQLSAADEVKVGGTVVISQGAPATGQVIEAVPRRATTSGKLDFSVASVMAADGQPIPLRYSQDKKAADNSLTNGLLGSGATMMFGPTVVMLRMMRAKDVILQRGTIVEVFTDQSHVVQSPAPADAAANPARGGNREDAGAPPPVRLVILSINATPAGAKISVDGTDIGETYVSYQIDPGDHTVQIEKEGFAIWKRKITAKAGTPIDLDVKLKPPVAASTAKTASKAGVASKPRTSP